MREVRPRRGTHATALHHLQPRIERDLPQRDHHADAGQLFRLRIEVIEAARDLLSGLLAGGAQRTAMLIYASRSIRPSPACVEVARLANPATCSAAMRKSPEPPVPSPVNTRPVRFAPCAAGRARRSGGARGDPRSPAPAGPSTRRHGRRASSRARRRDNTVGAGGTARMTRSHAEHQPAAATGQFGRAKSWKQVSSGESE